MINIAIIEDEPVDLENIKTLLGTYEAQKDCPMKTDSFTSGESFLCAKGTAYDLIFMDMQLGGMDGIETSRKLREHNPDVIIVIVTSLMQYAIQGYSIKAADYLLKPLEYDRFAEKMDEFYKLIQKKRKYIVVKTENGMAKIRISDIAFLEVFGHQLYMIYSGKRERVISTLSKMEAELSPYGFVKCNKCYLVNLAMVEGIYGDDVEVGGKLLKISRREKADFIQKLTRFAEG
ncbi:MAG: response regulator transcription factor [Parasporobacterium sp.]|nr:response regulator transcription factor [Parasporobacterium sp.]